MGIIRHIQKLIKHSDINAGWHAYSNQDPYKSNRNAVTQSKMEKSKKTQSRMTKTKSESTATKHLKVRAQTSKQKSQIPSTNNQHNIAPPVTIQLWPFLSNSYGLRQLPVWVVLSPTHYLCSEWQIRAQVIMLIFKVGPPWSVSFPMFNRTCMFHESFPDSALSLSLGKMCLRVPSALSVTLERLSALSGNNSRALSN